MHPIFTWCRMVQWVKNERAPISALSTLCCSLLKSIPVPCRMGNFSLFTNNCTHNETGSVAKNTLTPKQFNVFFTEQLISFIKPTDGKTTTDLHMTEMDKLWKWTESHHITFEQSVWIHHIAHGILNICYSIASTIDIDFSCFCAHAPRWCVKIIFIL